MDREIKGLFTALGIPETETNAAAARRTTKVAEKATREAEARDNPPPASASGSASGSAGTPLVPEKFPLGTRWGRHGPEMKARQAQSWADAAAAAASGSDGGGRRSKRKTKRKSKRKSNKPRKTLKKNKKQKKKRRSIKKR